MNPADVSRSQITVRSRSVLILLLATTSGATDVVGYLALGGTFTSVMTGNLVLLGVAAANADLAMATRTVAAVGSFVLGAWFGTRIARGLRDDDRDTVWPRGITRALWVELALLVVFAAWWWLGRDRIHGEWLWPALMLSACALGIQSGAIIRFGVSGLSTTYLTGTLTSVVVNLTSGKGLKQVRHPLAVLAALVVGAAAGAFLVAHGPAWVPVLQLVPLIVVLLSVSGLRRRRADARLSRQDATDPSSVSAAKVRD